MLKVTTNRDARTVNLKVEGRLISTLVGELERYWREDIRQGGKDLVLDLRAVTFIDAAGKDLLLRMYLDGAKLEASGPMVQGIVDEVQAQAASSNLRSATR